MPTFQRPPPAARATRTGAAPRAILLFVALLALVVAGAAWLLHDGGDAQPIAITGGGGTSAQPGSVDLASPSSAQGPSSLSGDDAFRSGASATGVRLPGPAKLDGRVLERASGQGVAGVRVELLPVPPAGTVFLSRMLRLTGFGDEMSERVRPIASALTDAGGAFHFQGVRQGNWYVDARGDHHVPESVVRTRVAASGDGGPLDVFVLAGGRVLGTVLLPDGKPARNAKVAFVSGPGNFFTTARTGDMRWLETVSDENGRFLFGGVPEGSGYELTATGTGFTISHALDVDVKAGQDTQVVLQTRVGGTITGRIFTHVEDKEPVPLAGAHLGVVPRGLRNLRCVEEVLEITHGVSGPDGAYVLRNVPPGEVDVLAIAWEHLPAVGARVAAADAATSEASDIELSKGPLVRGRVVDEKGDPIAGVTPHWNMVDWKNFQFDLSFAPLMLATVKGFDLPKSDPEGAFWAGPIAGKAPYSIDFTKAGWIDQELKWDPEKDGAEVTVVLHRGSAVEGVVMDELRSEPVTSFTITSSDRVDMEGEAPGARNPYSGGQLVEDEHGRFQLASVRPGRASLTFRAPGYLTKTVEVDVADGQPTRGIIVKLVPGGVVRGRVVDDRGEPVAGAQVVAVDPSGNPGARNARRERMRERRTRNGMRAGFMFDSAEAQSGNPFPPGMMAYAAGLGLLGDKVKLAGGDGAFEITGVDPGRVKVLAFHRDHTSGESEELVMAENGVVEGVVVTMPKGGGIEGVVRDRHGVPVAGELVVAFSPSSFDPRTGGGATGLYQGHSDAQGAYEIEHVSPGSYFLVATRGDADLNPMSFFGNFNFDLVTVPAGEVVKFDLVDSSAGACRVYGTVTYKGKPIERGNLSAVTFDTDNLLGVEWKAARMLGDGKFEFAGLAPGEYQLNLDNNGPQVHMPLEVPDLPEMHVDLRLPESGLEGRVVDQDSGAPIPRAEVVLRAEAQMQGSGLLGGMLAREGRSQRKWTNDEGGFAFERLAPGEYTLTARAGGRRGDPDGGPRTAYAPSDPLSVRIDENRTERDRVVMLQPALTLAGRVVDATKSPIEGATVLVVMQKGDVVESDKSGADGTFSVTGLAPGKYRVTASRTGYADGVVADVEVRRDASEPPRCEVVLQRGVHVRVRVYGASGAPVSGARAELFPLEGERTNDPANAGRAIESLFSGEGATDANGLVDLGRYMPGKYRLEAQRGFSKASDPRVVLEAGRDEVELKIDLP